MSRSSERRTNKNEPQTMTLAPPSCGGRLWLAVDEIELTPAQADITDRICTLLLSVPLDVRPALLERIVHLYRRALEQEQEQERLRLSNEQAAANVAAVIRAVGRRYAEIMVAGGHVGGTA
jgi:hypothetical protein